MTMRDVAMDAHGEAAGGGRRCGMNRWRAHGKGLQLFDRCRGIGAACKRFEGAAVVRIRPVLAGGRDSRRRVIQRAGGTSVSVANSPLAKMAQRGLKVIMVVCRSKDSTRRILRLSDAQ
jgi:hypothetical protein